MKTDLINLDLRQQVLENRTFEEGRIAGCNGEGVSFRGSRFSALQIVATKAERASFRGADFSGAKLADCVIGPATLDLESTIWKEATLREIRFDFARLKGADFSGASLTNVYFKAGQLDNVSFRGARLQKVSFEKASLVNADFTDAVFLKMDFWGEPNWTEAIIADELRYQFGELDKPAERVNAALSSQTLDAEVRDGLQKLLGAHADLLAAPACMLIGRQLTDIIPPGVFPRLLKTLKEVSLSRGVDLRRADQNP